ncbi:MAG TPA: SulP family inorganic anion transporter [Thiothrix sp.]|nr:SulP family inorganic anion transporter [Thiothrix sp.]
MHTFFPFLIWFKLINKASLKADFMAGITGAVIVLPQGVAFATIAGLPPEYGLYTAMVTPIIAALFGSSYHLISGPTTAISIVVFSSISHYVEPGSAEFVSMALTLTFLAGVYQLAFGLARLGALVNFVSHTVVIGFTAGAAILIITSQMKSVLGIAIPKGESFLHTWYDVFAGFQHINLYILAVATITLLVAIASKRFFPRLPNLLIALIIGGLTASLLQGEQQGIQFIGEIPAKLPPLSLPDFSFATLKMLAPDAFAVALLGLIEAVSISRAIASQSNQHIEPNQEFIGQGLSNMGGSFFSSYAGSGSFTRSGVNYASGAKTPLSAIFAAIILALIVLLIAPLTRYLPTAAMGGVILVVAYSLIDFPHIKHIIHNSKTETAILLTTFFATLFLELEFAIYMGVLLSLVIFLAKTSIPEIETLAPDKDEKTGKHILTNINDKPLNQCPQFKIIRFDMSIYFGSISHMQNRLHKIVENERIYHILIEGSGINLIDLSGAEALVAEHKRLQALGGGLYFVGLHSAVYEFAARTCFIKQIGGENFFDAKKDAIHSIYSRLNKDVCANCQVQVFRECRY